MSKSNSSTRSNSMETPADASEGEVGSPQSNVPAAIMEAAEGQDVVPSSPPPSYEYVLEETKLIQAKAEASTPSAETFVDYNRNRHPVEIVHHKSSKKLYKAVAKQFGVTCKLSDQCRCFDCQSNYFFDCQMDEQTETFKDAVEDFGQVMTPIYISDAVATTGCTIV